MDTSLTFVLVLLGAIGEAMLVALGVAMLVACAYFIYDAIVPLEPRRRR